MGGDDAERRYWNDRYSTEDRIFGEEPAHFLIEVEELLPEKGRALDLAGGHGRNAIWLARRGLDVDLWDISGIALEKASEAAAARGVRLRTKEVDLEKVELEPASYDLVICFYYTQRSLFHQMAAALKPGGVLVMENMTTEQAPGERSSRNPEFRLKPNELLGAFPGLRVLRYREGPVPAGIPKGKYVASIVATRE